MGFEIKNIYTVVPNPHHPLYSDDEGKNYYYFSVFITPKLQFDGTLKEFYEMLNWPKVVETVFWSFESNDHLKYVNLIFSNNQNVGKNLVKDYSFVKKLSQQMGIIENDEELTPAALKKFFSKSKAVWEKLFHENMPVEAWPIYLKPQNSNKIDDLIKNIDLIKQKIREVIPFNDEDFILAEKVGRFPSTKNPVTDSKIADFKKELDANNKILESERAKKGRIKLEKTKYRQEFHKKISALSRYPHMLRILGLIQDFKILKSDLNEQIKTDVSSFHTKLNFDLASLNTKEMDTKEFKKSIQFITPYTRCSLRDELDNDSDMINLSKARLRAFYSADTNDPDAFYRTYYGNYVNNGFLRTHFLYEEAKKNPTKVFEVDQDYFEDRTQDFKNSNQINATKNNEETTKVVGINGKVFNDEEIEILKQKVSNKPRISKGFSIKVHSQHGNLLTGMDEKLKELTDDNIESEESAFMAHHLDCGYRVDVNVITLDENKKYLQQTNFHSLCIRQAEYVVDRKKNSIHIPVVNINIPLHEVKLFTQLVDEPWLEEVRLVNNDGSEDRFEEIARWNGWSLTCPPLNNNNSAENNEGDDLELRDIKPIHLPKLRFGDSYQYQFRIRTVDICGNGPQLNTHNNFPQECIFKGPSYDRKEGIGAPLFFPTYEIIPDLNDTKKENSKKKIDERYKGEDNETLVIRTKIKKDGTPELINEECIRYITPPYVTMHFAEASGMLDNLYDKAKNDSDALSELYKKLAVEPEHYYAKKNIENKEIPFLFDSKIQHIEILEVNNVKGNAEDIFINSQSFYDSETKDILSTRPLKLTLSRDRKSLINQSEIFPIIAPGYYRSYKIISVGTDNLKSESKEFRLIHAVQKPVLLNGGKWNNNISQGFTFNKIIPLKDTSVYKEDQKYQVQIDISILTEVKDIFPFSTAGEIVVHAEYNEFELNPANPNGWSYIAKDYPKTVKGKSQPGIGEDGDEKKADKFYIRKSWSNLDDETESDKLDTLLNDEEYVKGLTSGSFDSFKHPYPDTKFRKVKYRLEAVSKFSEFFDIEKHDIDKNDSNPFSIFAMLDKEFDGNEYHTIIANSAKPSKPNITSIVPIFTITNPNRENGNTYTFEHKTFRVYLGSTWYETGLDEKIAVIHEERANTLPYEDNGDPNVTMDTTVNPIIIKDSSYIKNKISIFANDPTDSILNTKDSVVFSSERYIDSIHLDSSYIKPIDSLKVNTYLFESTVEKTCNINGIKKEHVFSVFNVKWCMEQNQFYADIELNMNALSGYTYFLKFAICRYQENSILLKDKYDYRFSDVVMTDMVSTLPKREIVVTDNDVKIKNGVQGGRYSINNSVTSFKPNKIYLIEEKEKQVDHDVTKSFSKYLSSPPKGIDFEEKINISKGGSIFIEEYEDILLNEDFEMIADENYNPRNDPRKRLVFFYKIK